MSEIDINALMIGKSGSGKSSLLNYLCGSELEETGTGKPVTRKGIYEHIVEVKAGSKLHVYDTWGLEPNKTEEWLQLIYEKLEQHNIDDIREWFHFIIYCINAQTARVEDFEIGFIQKLLQENNSIIFVLTNCDRKDNKAILGVMKTLYKLGINTENIIRVCSVNKVLVGGKEVLQFGREEVIDKIQRGFWKNICNRIPNVINQNSKKMLMYTTKQLKDYAESSIHFHNVHSDRNFDRINAYCNKKYRELFSEINVYANRITKEAVNYYIEVCDILGGKDVLKRPYFKSKSLPEMDFSMDFSDKLIENIAMFVFSLLPGAVFLLPSIEKEIKQDEYKSCIDNATEKMETKLDEMCDEIKLYLDGLSDN